MSSSSSSESSLLLCRRFIVGGYDCILLFAECSSSKGSFTFTFNCWRSVLLLSYCLRTASFIVWHHPSVSFLFSCGSVMFHILGFDRFGAKSHPYNRLIRFKQTPNGTFDVRRPPHTKQHKYKYRCKDDTNIEQHTPTMASTWLR